MNYGATGNRTTDDSTAITAALSALQTAGGGVLYCPPGTYSLQTETLAWTAATPITIQGDGMGATNFCMAYTATSCTAMSFSNAPRVNLRDFSIITDTTASSFTNPQVAVSMTSVPWSSVNRVVTQTGEAPNRV